MKPKPKKPVKKQNKARGKSEVALNMPAASEKTGLRIETIKALRKKGASAFKKGGRINCDELKQNALENVDLVKQTESLPDYNFEKAARAQVQRRLEEVELEKSLGSIASLDICRRILIRGGKFALSKLMAIPDRTAEKFSLMDDAAKIREILIEEITSALRTLSEESVDKLIKEILEESK